jgi:hypothetical protein
MENKKYKKKLNYKILIIQYSIKYNNTNKSNLIK